MPDALEFEQPLLELENAPGDAPGAGGLAQAREEIAKLEERLERPAPEDLCEL